LQRGRQQTNSCSTNKSTKELQQQVQQQQVQQQRTTFFGATMSSLNRGAHSSGGSKNCSTNSLTCTVQREGQLVSLEVRYYFTIFMRCSCGNSYSRAHVAVHECSHDATPCCYRGCRAHHQNLCARTSSFVLSRPAFLAKELGSAASRSWIHSEKQAHLWLHQQISLCSPTTSSSSATASRSTTTAEKTTAVIL
jgi:hypothetical protein